MLRRIRAFIADKRLKKEQFEEEMEEYSFRFMIQKMARMAEDKALRFAGKKQPGKVMLWSYRADMLRDIR